MSDPFALDVWPLVFAALVVPVLVWLPGHLVLRVIASDPPQSPTPAAAEVPSRLESACITFAVSLSMLGWVSVLLAELGQLGLGAVCAVLAVACVVTALIPKPATSAVSSSARPAAPQILALIGILLLAAVLYFPSFPTVLWASDSTVYINYGRQISDSGAFVLDDPLLADLAPDVRASLFENPDGTHARLPGGFLIAEPAEPTVTAGFSPLFPALMALFHQWQGVKGMLLLTPLFGVMSVGVLYLVGVRLHSGFAGLLAATLLAVSAPQIWFAKFTLPATVAQFFVLAGLLTLLVALAGARARLAVLAGWLFGTAMFAKFDLLAVLPVAMGSLLLVAGFLPRREHRRVLGYLALGFLVPLVHNAVHFLVSPTHYSQLLARMLSRLLVPETAILMGTVMAIGVLVAAWGIRTGHLGARWLVGVRGRTGMLTAILGAYALNYLRLSDNDLGYTVPWLGWYLSWPVVGLLAAAVFFVLWRWHQHRDVPLMVVLVLLATACFHYLYDLYEVRAELIWSMRRFVPIVIPLSLLLVSVLLASMLHQLTRWRRWVSALVCAGLVGVVGRPSLAFLGQPLWTGAAEQTAEVAQLLPEESVVLVGRTLSGTHLQTSLTYLYDRPAVVVRPGFDDPRFLEDVVRRWLETEKRVFLMVGDQDAFSMPGLSASTLEHVTLTVPMLEATVSRRPTRVIGRTADLRLFEVALTGTPRKVFDVGKPGDDIVFDLRGFHAAETDPDPEKGTYRWTGAEASVRVPATPQIRVTWDGWRPEGVEPARVSLWLDGHSVLDDVVLPDTLSSVTVTNPVARRDATTELRVQSSVFVPESIGLSTDRRPLGARVYRLEFNGFE